MSEFDPYRKWLGVASKRRPPSHYELLGVSLDEDDAEVIDGALERRTAFVRDQLGKGHDGDVQAILLQLKEAKIVLNDPESRRDYDRQRKLFAKRRKRRRVDPNAPVRSADGLPPRTAGRKASATVGEGSDFLRTYAGVVAILAVAFGGIVWWSFQQPWAAPPVVAEADRENALFDAITSDAAADAVTDAVTDAQPVAARPAAPEPPPAAPNATGESEWIDLIGDTMSTHWTDRESRGYQSKWAVRGGILTVPNNGTSGVGSLLSRESFADFELVAECRTDRDSRAAICLRMPGDSPVGAVNKALEWNFGHYFDRVKKFGRGHEYGAIMRMAAVPAPQRIAVDDRWHELRMRLIGTTGECWIDGEPAYRFDTATSRWKQKRLALSWLRPSYAQAADGHLVLVPGRGRVEFRKVAIRRLVSRSAPPIFTPYDPTGQPQVVEMKTETWTMNQTSHARRTGPRSFDLGFGREGRGFAEAGWHMRNVRTVTVDGSVSGDFQSVLPHANVGVIVDYHTRNGFVRRVLFTSSSSDKTNINAPSWAGGQPAQAIVHRTVQPTKGQSKRGLGTLELMQWAPSDWTHEAWITAHIQDTGPNTRFYGTLQFEN